MCVLSAHAESTVCGERCPGRPVLCAWVRQDGHVFHRGHIHTAGGEADGDAGGAPHSTHAFPGMDMQGMVGRANRNGMVAVGFVFRRVVYQNVLANCWVRGGGWQGGWDGTGVLLGWGGGVRAWVRRCVHARRWEGGGDVKGPAEDVM
jgi:hypothetical protein